MHAKSPVNLYLGNLVGKVGHQGFNPIALWRGWRGGVGRGWGPYYLETIWHHLWLDVPTTFLHDSDMNRTETFFLE